MWAAQRNRRTWPRRRGELASDDVRYAGAQSSVGHGVRSKVRPVWESFLIAAGALKTPVRNGYNAQGVNLRLPVILRLSTGKEISGRHTHNTHIHTIHTVHNTHTDTPNTHTPHTHAHTNTRHTRHTHIHTHTHKHAIQHTHARAHTRTLTRHETQTLAVVMRWWRLLRAGSGRHKRVALRV